MFRIVTHETDDFAVSALKTLKKGRPSIEVAFLNGDHARSTDVAVFTLGKEFMVHFPGRHIRMAAHRLLEAGVVPEWAATTPYLAALRVHPREKTRNSIKEAVSFLADSYAHWFTGRKCTCPWGCEPEGESLDFFRKWQQKALNVGEGEPEEVQRFLSTLEPLSMSCMQETVKRVKEGGVTAVSAFCFHSDQERACVVDRLDPQIQQATAGLVEDLPVKRLDLFTFHPGDMEVLAQYDLQDVVLSTLWGNEKQIRKHWQLSEGFANLSDKIQLLPLKKLFENEVLVRSAWKTAESRAKEMMKSIMKNPPPVFEHLSPEEQRRRLAREAVLYLLMTAQYSQSVYVGLEVHTEYWRTGELYEWGDSYLPVNMVPSALRQHWAPWAVNEDRMQKIRMLGVL